MSYLIVILLCRSICIYWTILWISNKFKVVFERCPTSLRFMGVKWVRESDKYSVKTESHWGCMQYSSAESSNISKFVYGIIKCLCSESSGKQFFDKCNIQKWRQPDKWTWVNISKVKSQHLVSLFTLFRNNLVSAY